MRPWIQYFLKYAFCSVQTLISKCTISKGAVIKYLQGKRVVGGGAQEISKFFEKVSLPPQRIKKKFKTPLNGMKFSQPPYHFFRIFMVPQGFTKMFMSPAITITKTLLSINQEQKLFQQKITKQAGKFSNSIFSFYVINTFDNPS